MIEMLIRGGSWTVLARNSAKNTIPLYPGEHAHFVRVGIRLVLGAPCR